MAIKIRILISFRSQDDERPARELFEQLSLALPASEVLIDARNHLQLSPGDDFANALIGVVQGCNVFLPVIGPRWADDMVAHADDPDDVVTIEVTAALNKVRAIIPVLIADTGRLRAVGLPRSIQPLSRIEPIRLRPESFQADCKTLAHLIAKPFAEEERAQRQRELDEAARQQAKFYRQLEEQKKREAESEPASNSEQEGRILALIGLALFVLAWLSWPVPGIFFALPGAGFVLLALAVAFIIPEGGDG